MTKKNRKPPSYRQRKGYNQALVTLTDAVTRQRRDYWLGEYGTSESREFYHQILAEWEAKGRRLPAPPQTTDGPLAGTTVAEVLAAYRNWAGGIYREGDLIKIHAVIRLVRRMFGSTPAVNFGPRALRLVRDQMVCGDATAEPPRAPWSRPYVNEQVHRIRAIFRWAASHEMLPASVYEQLRTVEALKRGRTAARERQAVKPVVDEMVDAIKPFVSRQVWALIQLQRFTGARGGELFALRPVDIDMSDQIWTYSPNEHKTAHHGKTRTIYFGPRAQAVIQPFLEGRAIHAYLFSPMDAEAQRRQKRHAERRTPLGYGNQPGTNRVETPRCRASNHYTSASYRRAIERACDQAFPPAKDLCRIKVIGPKGRRWETMAQWAKRLGPKHWAELLTWRKTHRWHPHQLRHAAGTRIRREFGLEAAQIALGHSSALVTDAVYAERDMTKAVEIMKKIG